MKTKSILSFGALIAVTMTTMSLFGSSITFNVGAQEQPIDTTQAKNYLTQAIQALDSGNNTMALEQLDLAEAAMAGTADDDEGEVEEGPGEDEDEPGDVDTTDEEDTP